MRTLIICLAAYSFAHAAEIRVALEPQSARKPAPHFVLLDRSGKSVSLESFKRKPLVLDLWATKCGGCVKGDSVVHRNSPLREHWACCRAEGIHRAQDGRTSSH